MNELRKNSQDQKVKDKKNGKRNIVINNVPLYKIVITNLVGNVFRLSALTVTGTSLR